MPWAMRNIRKWAPQLAVVLFLTGFAGVAAAEEPTAPTAQDMLAKSDTYRLPELENQLHVHLSSFKGAQEDSTANYTVWVKGTDKSRVEMLDPKVRGQRVLMTDDGMWLFVPNTRQSIRITPMQRLLGEANYGDIGRMVWRDDYTAEFDAARASEAVDGVKAKWLILTARKSAAVYARINLAVDAADSRPLYAEYFLSSGKRLKTAKFDLPGMVRDKPVVMRVTFTDDIIKEKRTIMELRARPEMILRFLRLDCYQVSFSACFHGHLQSRRLHGESYLQL
jgi:outer membrane lipoprotein-sorting protein